MLRCRKSSFKASVRLSPTFLPRVCSTGAGGATTLFVCFCRQRAVGQNHSIALGRVLSCVFNEKGVRGKVQAARMVSRAGLFVKVYGGCLLPGRFS